MTWFVCFVFAMLVLISAVVFASVISRGRYKRGRVLTPFNLVFGALFISVAVCLLPIYYSLLEDTSYRVLKTVAFALHNTFQTFTIDADREIILESVNCPNESLSALYSAFLSVAFVAAPVLTFGFAMSFFRNLSALSRYIAHWFADAYVFSELNERSITLGSDIKRNHRRAVIVYTDVFDNNDEASYELLEKARELNAICFKKDILGVNFSRHSAKKKIVFFTIGKNETENTDQSLALVEQYGQRENTQLYVFSTGVEGELLLSRGNQGPMRVRRVNEVRSLINRILYEQGNKLFDNAKLMESGDRKISAVLVGLGAHGTEMLKALSWYCQMDGFHLEIDAFDIDKKAQDRLEALAPELISEKYNGKKAEGEAEYTIRIHSGFDVGGKAFAAEIRKLTDATYAFVSLGSDEKNIAAAVNLRMLFERMEITPVIQAVVSNSAEKRALQDLTNFRGQAYNIEYLGDTASSYSEKVIMDSELEAEALERHLKWGKEEEFWRYEYNYNSSVASAIHMKARIACRIPGADKKEEDLTDEEKNVISVLEHRRWNAYMRSEGYIYSKKRNDLGKMHHDLVDFSALSGEEKRKDEKVGSK